MGVRGGHFGDLPLRLGAEGGYHSAVDLGRHSGSAVGFSYPSRAAPGGAVAFTTDPKTEQAGNNQEREDTIDSHIGCLSGLPRLENDPIAVNRTRGSHAAQSRAAFLVV